MNYQPKLFSSRHFNWVLLLIFGIIGAVLGWVFGLIMPPVYEAESVITTNFEIVKDTNITELMIDAEIGLIGDLLFHSDIIDQVLFQELKAGNQLTLEDLKEKTNIERRLMNTVIKVRGNDPEVAARIASNWAEIAFMHLQEAYEHALVVSEVKAVMTNIEDCLYQNDDLDAQFCLTLDGENLDVWYDEMQAILIDESPKSLGLTSALNISHFQEASIPEDPENFQQGILILAGSAIGVIIFFVINEMTSPQKEKNV